jgi:putative peptidoglycan lipid II flippase
VTTPPKQPDNASQTERLIDVALDAPPTVSLTAPTKAPAIGGAGLVFIGILSSRIAGIVRDMLRAQYLGATIGLVGDAWTMAIRIPNLLQNLLGEGVLSASFIPVYTRLLADGDEEEAGRLAGGVLAILFVVMSVAVALGVVLAPAIVHLIANEYVGEKFDLTVHLVRILFPGAALFVLAAWCIGILNSHRKFLLPYFAPVFWNLTMIVAFVWFGRGRHLPPPDLVKAVAWASVLGAALQFLVQLPSVLRFAKRIKVRFDHRRESVRRVLRNFGPVALSRGVVQISQFLDLWIANHLPQGSPTVLMTAQTVNLLPISLFGIAVSASELPEMSSVTGTDDERAALLRRRITNSVRRIAYFVIPSAVAFVLLGDVIIRVLYERGQWLAIDTKYAWGTLAGSAFGLLASTLGRLYSAAFYAMHDTRRPLRFALIRVSLTVAMGYLAAIPLTNALGIDKHWGTAGLTLTAGMAGWVEFALLRRALQQRIGDVSIPVAFMMRLWAIAVGAGLVGYGIQRTVEPLFPGMRHTLHSIVTAGAVLGAYGVVYLATTSILKVPEATALTSRLLRR